MGHISGVFDTIVICTLTALVILTTGANLQSGLEGVNITIYAFESVLGKWGSYIVSIGIVMFAFSTILGWSVYGSRAAEYIGGKKLTAVYKNNISRNDIYRCRVEHSACLGSFRYV